MNTNKPSESRQYITIDLTNQKESQKYPVGPPEKCEPFSPAATPMDRGSTGEAASMQKHQEEEATTEPTPMLRPIATAASMPDQAAHTKDVQAIASDATVALPVQTSPETPQSATPDVTVALPQAGIADQEACSSRETPNSQNESDSSNGNTQQKTPEQQANPQADQTAYLPQVNVPKEASAAPMHSSAQSSAAPHNSDETFQKLSTAVKVFIALIMLFCVAVITIISITLASSGDKLTNLIQSLGQQTQGISTSVNPLNSSSSSSTTNSDTTVLQGKISKLMSAYTNPSEALYAKLTNDITADYSTLYLGTPEESGVSPRSLAEWALADISYTALSSGDITIQPDGTSATASLTITAHDPATLLVNYIMLVQNSTQPASPDPSAYNRFLGENFKQALNGSTKLSDLRLTLYFEKVRGEWVLEDRLQQGFSDEELFYQEMRSLIDPTVSEII